MRKRKSVSLLTREEKVDQFKRKKKRRGKEKMRKRKIVSFLTREEKIDQFKRVQERKKKRK